MKRFLSVNEHPIERLLRIVVGGAVLALAFVGPKTPWAYLGAIPLLTGLLGSCPLYSLLGVSTCPRPKTESTTRTPTPS